jgi:hypothetical protein
LPATYRANEYKEFVELFGTHFVRKVQMGGMSRSPWGRFFMFAAE